MGWTIALLLVGLVALVVGADSAVDAGRRIARTFGMSELLVGLTITSIGTSLPELATSATAAVSSGGDGGAAAAEVALGNILGSNMFVLSALLGATGLVAPLTVRRRSVVRDGAVICIGMLLLLAFSWGGEIGRVEGALMVCGYLLYLTLVVRQELAAEASRVPPPPLPPTTREVLGKPGPTLAPTDLTDEIADALADAAAEATESDHEPAPTVTPDIEPADWRLDALKLGGGLAVVLVGANLVVDQGVTFATAIGLSGTLIGVLVGVGTSLPEVVVTVRAASKGATDLGVGNMLGSAATNLLLCFGVAALAHPLVVPAEVMQFDWVFTAAVTAIALLLMYEQRDLTRPEGGALAILFSLYLYLRIAVI